MLHMVAKMNIFQRKFKHNPATFPISGNAAIRIGFLSNFGL